MLLTLLKYLKHYIELIKLETSSNIITVRLKKRKVICEQCHIKMHFHGFARQRKVLIGESSWIVYRPLRYICPRCRRTKAINIPSVKPKARITEECKGQIIKALKYRVSINEVAKRYGISHTTVTRLLRSYNTTIDWEKFEGDLRLGIDEHSFRGYDMVTSVRGLTTHTQ